MHDLAKRAYNATPDPILLTFASGETYEFALSSAEFFQDDFEAEGIRADDVEADYRLTTDEDGANLLVGRRAPGETEWTVFGTVTAVERVQRQS